MWGGRRNGGDGTDDEMNEPDGKEEAQYFRKGVVYNVKHEMSHC